MAPAATPRLATFRHALEANRHLAANWAALLYQLRWVGPLMLVAMLAANFMFHRQITAAEQALAASGFSDPAAEAAELYWESLSELVAALLALPLLAALGVAWHRTVVPTATRPAATGRYLSALFAISLPMTLLTSLGVAAGLVGGPGSEFTGLATAVVTVICVIAMIVSARYWLLLPACAAGADTATASAAGQGQRISLIAGSLACQIPVMILGVAALLATEHLTGPTQVIVTSLVEAVTELLAMALWAAFLALSWQQLTNGKDGSDANLSGPSLAPLAA